MRGRINGLPAAFCGAAMGAPQFEQKRALGGNADPQCVQ